MQVFKCKMCGGTLNIENGTTVAECEFCGRKQTIPKLDDEKRANLYDRANHFRRNNDYDKAMGIYEIILNEDKTDAEAYWSILLCKYGVEYVEDPTTHKRVPTINRTQFTSITKDVDYKNALKYADGYQRDIYQEEAKEIDKIQKGILAISGKEEPFDIFICYKETDHSGRRTIDSVLAQELYYNLKNEGFKVFFSRITLEDKLGVAYEPYIFAALNSAKVMVVIGSKTEYFNAVWVKNEWSRYLSLIRKGEKKTLIPAYKDIDPYDLPEEFSHLQAQDMNKLGFMQDLVYGIKKIIGKTSPQPVVRETVIMDNHAHDTAPLIRRAFLFLEDGDFDSAEEYTEKVLDANPECAEAYFIKLLIELGLRKPELLTKSETVISESSNYKKALRFADKKFGEKLVEYNDSILNNIGNRRKENIYQSACEALTDSRYLEAIKEFSKIVNYKDSAEKIELCKASIEKERKDRIYKNALARLNIINVNDIILKQSISDLQSIIDYKDSEQKITELQARLEKYYYDKKVAEEKAKIRAEEERLKKLREAELRKINAEKRKQKIKKAARIGLPSLAALIVVLILTFTLFIPTGKYNKANDLINDGKYEEALEIYKDLDGFSDSETKINFIKALQTVENGELEKGIEDALAIGAKVNLTYEFDGGNFAESKTSELVNPMSFVTLAEEVVETEKTYTYTKTEDFSGLKTPSKQGYDFNKWDLTSCSANVTKNYNTLNIRLVAMWNAKMYSISYNLDGGKVDTDNPIAYNPDDKTFTLVNPTKTGYTFIGWTGTDLTDKTEIVNVLSGSYGNRSYTANWQANQYTITYNPNEGTLASITQTVTFNKEETLAVPSRLGYKFLGWFDENKKYTDGVWVTDKSIELKAEWEIIEYQIIYNLNGGNTTNQSTYTVLDSVTLSEPKKTGYTFRGWTGTDLSEETKSITLIQGTTGNKEYTANWTAKTYTVTYNGNNGTPSQNSDIATYDAYFTLATAERKGYKFIGWKADGKTYTNSNWKTDKNITLVADWEIINYTITYTLNGGSANNPKTYTVNDTISLLEPTRAGYSFKGWTFDGQTTPVKTVEFSNDIGNKTFTASWQANLNTIIFHANSGVGDMSQQQIYTDNTEKLNNNLFTKKGYTFMGWSTSSNGSIVYNNGADYAMGTNSTYNLYAVWSRDTYSITYNLNNGTAANPTTYNVDTNTFTLSHPTRLGYEFIGWTGTGLTDYTKTVTIQKGSIGSRTYTANWQVTIVFHSNNGNNEQTTQNIINKNTGILNANTFTHGEYIFNGWSTALNGEVVYSEMATITVNQPTLNLYAVWGGTVGLTYALNNDTYNVTGYNGIDKDIVIADKYRGVNVTAIGANAFSNHTNIENISLASTINSIGRYAFENVVADITWKLPTITTLGEYSFAEYKGKSLEIPSTVIDVQSYAFKDSTANIRWNNATISTIEAYAFAEYKGNSVEIPSSISRLKDYAFYNCTELTEIYYNAITIFDCSDNNHIFYNVGGNTQGIVVYVNNKVERIPRSLFNTNNKNCNVKEVVFADDSICSFVGGWAFAMCNNLESINLPDTLTNLGVCVFQTTTKLSSLVIPNADVEIAKYFSDFYSETSWNNIYDVPSSLKYVKVLTGESIAMSAFIGTNIETIELPKTISYMSENAFGSPIKKVIYHGSIEDWCKIEYYNGGSNPLHNGADLYIGDDKLTELTIPTTITNLLPYAFYGCGSLIKLNIPNTVSSFGNDIFNGCTNLTTVDIESGVLSIGARAFYGCTSLISVTMADTLETIGESAFADCTSLVGIEIPSSVTAIGNSAFSRCVSIQEIKYNAVSCNDFNSSSYIFSDVGKNATQLIATIGNEVKAIPAYFFCNFSSNESYITKLEFEENSSCLSIGNYAFYACKLEKLEIPDSVVTIGTAAFERNNLQMVNFGQESNLRTIGGQAFSSCSFLKEIKIPNKVTTIGVQAFLYCYDLTSIVIPKAVTTIEYGVFSYCHSLTTVYYCGTSTEWGAIDRTGGAPSEGLVQATIYFFSEDKPSLNVEETDYDGNYWHYVDGVPTIWVYISEE